VRYSLLKQDNGDFMIKTALLLIATLFTIFLLKAYSFGAPLPGDYRPDSAYDSANDRYLSLYETYDAASGFSIYGQLVDHYGAPLGGAFLIAAGSSSPSIAYDSSNSRFIVIYIKGSGSDADIHGQLLNNDGTLLGGSLRISEVSSYMHNHGPTVAYDANTTKFLVAWSFGSVSSDIYAQLLTDNMTKDGSNFVISNATNSQYRPFGHNFKIRNPMLHLGTYPHLLYSGTHFIYILKCARGTLEQSQVLGRQLSLRYTVLIGSLYIIRLIIKQQ